jgi:hypothetical protein
MIVLGDSLLEAGEYFVALYARAHVWGCLVTLFNWLEHLSSYDTASAPPST